MAMQQLADALEVAVSQGRATCWPHILAPSAVSPVEALRPLLRPPMRPPLRPPPRNHLEYREEPARDCVSLRKAERCCNH